MPQLNKNARRQKQTLIRLYKTGFILTNVKAKINI